MAQNPTDPNWGLPKEVTALAPVQEAAFKAWAQKNKLTDVDDPRSFYDYRGYWKDVASKGADQRKEYADGLHFPDTYKQHGHPTFSIESKYSTGSNDGGTWKGETYVPANPTDPNWGLAAQKPRTEGDAGALALAGGTKAVPVAANLATRFATNPNVPKVAATIGRTVGAVGPIVAGAATYGVPGAIGGTVASAKSAWLGGRTGWFTGKLAQNMTMPVAKALTAVTPYLQTLSTASGAQGVLDLAQMADPKRTDIGFLGIGKSPTAESMKMSPEQFAEYNDTHPAVLNLLAMKASDAVKALVASGVSKADALKSYFTLKQYTAKAKP